MRTAVVVVQPGGGVVKRVAHPQGVPVDELGNYPNGILSAEHSACLLYTSAPAAVGKDYRLAEVVSHVTIADANNGEAVVFANGGWGDYTYHWSNGQATANAMGLAPGTYTVTVTDAQGCETQCSVTILLDVTEEDCELYIPDAFSPNDDGSNDYFKVLCIEKYPNAKFEVYNRWGNLLYEQENYGNQDRWNSIDAWWDGTSNRKWTVGREKLPMGTYFYILHLNDGSKPITGSVFLNK